MSPIPLGILAASGVEAAVAGSYDLLATEDINSQVTSVTFSNLSTYSTDYDHLEFRLILRRQILADAAAANIFYNGDTTSTNYYYHNLQGNGSTISAFSGNRADLIHYSGDGNDFAGAIVQILDLFSSNKNTVARCLSGSKPAVEDAIRISSSIWNNTDPVTTIRFATGSVFGTGSRISMYGLKAA